MDSVEDRLRHQEDTMAVDLCMCFHALLDWCSNEHLLHVDMAVLNLNTLTCLLPNLEVTTKFITHNSFLIVIGKETR
ncbi:hypothetical protein DICVIV_10205 [Dictyocaulus viviparus]|uniref:Uncharacterized protein n=1 Tax=Dictyocaulus viviparus TaxID=29172 RepID=A0A0D8XN39_DICVI|nr:hypothetical protein DICVIV_10205 [Dictyocaulus viviparus]